MLKIKKYLLRFWPLILVSFALLFVQSQSELALPDYMSDIVSTGIQAGGFDSPVAEVLSADTYDHVMIFLSDQDQIIFQDSYEAVKNKDISRDLKDLYTKIKDQDIYVLKDLSREEESELETIMTKPMLLVSSIDSMDPDSEEYQQMTGNLPAGMDIYDAMALMGQEQKDKMFSNIDSQMETMGESTMKIAAGNSVKQEYIRLGRDVDAISHQYIFISGLKMLGIALIGTLSAITVAYCSSRFGAGVAKNLRKDVFDKVESFSNEEFSKYSTASLITRTTNDITQVQMVSMMMLRIIAFAPIMGIGALIKAISNSPSMTWIVGVVLIFITGIMLVTVIVVMPKFKIIQKLIDKLNLTMRENLSGMMVIRAFGNEKHSEDRFDEANRNLRDVNLFVNKAMASLMPIMMFIFNAVTLVIVYYGAKQIDLGNIAIGQMMAFMQYAMHIIMSFLMIAMIAIMVPRASVAAGRIYEVIATEPKITDPQDPRPFLNSQRGMVEFKNVSFQYPGAHEAVLQNISFKAYPGKTTAFIGSTGSGKSTLINLIPRFYEATDGEVLVNGVNVKDVSMHDLRDVIGLVPQKGVLFSGTIESNLKYGAPDISDEELAEVIAIAQAKEFIDEKEKGIRSPIAQGGSNVSGGQKQRLCIARALAKKPDIYIFDDSFSALDFKTDAKLRKELNKLIRQTSSTVLLVGQRIASIMDADSIIVLDQGRIVGQGTHQQLMESCQVYQEIAYSQLSKEELENA
ncbi:ABC transporter ATP-binding protein [[Clostridium] spiroforme]|nr:ABC transporter ATP-binding protein [Thomasclavelia spiroformis]MBM6880165.1 ABC transporter ATP-binding protein [Thomasclavelia spiroformis]MBM6930432.1 ABC transporter ATP-binding protein [Thomasclavelia spiroformis]